MTAPASSLLPVRIRNQVLFALVVAAAAMAAGEGFLAAAPNRLVSGRAIALWAAGDPAATAGVAALGMILLASSLAAPSRALHRAAGFAAAALLLLVLDAAGEAAKGLAAGASPVARISCGAAFWGLVGCAALAIVDAVQRAGAGPPAQLMIAATIAASFLIMAEGGVFEALSLAREYASRREVFAAALLRHIALVAGSVGPALLIGAPLGVGAARRARLRGPLFAVLNVLQTIPSVALFGLLIVPLSGLASAVPALAALGIGGVGMAPALIALVLYALLPVVRSTASGIGGVDRAAVEAATGMGLTSRQVFWQVEMPLASPVLLAGLRIVTVQAIGLAVVAALIGAGGLGTFVFEGLGQYAVDLVLLGALPAIGLALAADFGLGLLAAALRRRYAP